MSAMYEVYDITVYRDGRWWMIEIPAIDGLTQARRLAEVEEMARSYISVDQDKAASSVRVHVADLKVSDVDVVAAMEDVRRLREEARAAEAAASEVIRKTAWRLTEEGVTARDIGHVLGVSHQRVSQLVNE